MRKPPLESRVVKKIKTSLETRGGFWVKIHGSPLQIAGLPDLIGCYLGRFVAFEVKRASGIEATKLQQYMMKRIKAAGGMTALIHSVDEAFAVLDRIEALGRPQGPDQD